MPPAKVQFRCPHTKKTDFAPTDEAREIVVAQGREATPGALAKMAKALARRQMFDIPPSAKWKPVQDVRMGEHGILEVFDVGTYYTLVKCPVCHDTRKIVTDQVVI